jgi:hypothetical protein
MKKITIIASVLLFSVVQVLAQKEFKIAKNSGKLVINNISKLSIEGYDGKDIVFSTINVAEKTDDPRATGLSVLGNAGFDNTGIGISVTEKDNNMVVAAIAKDTNLKVKLPQGVSLSIKTGSFSHRDSIIILLSNIKSEIDASTQYEHISLKNVSGPVSIKTLYGNIDGKLAPSFKGPISLVSVYGFIDVTLPEEAKADMSINTVYETLYAAKDIKLVLDEAPKRENVAFGTAAFSGVYSTQNGQVITLNNQTPAKANEGSGGNQNVQTVTTTATSLTGKATPVKSGAIITGGSPLTYTIESPIFGGFSTSGTVVNGKLNGGGEKIILKSTHGKIYLRK